MQADPKRRPALGGRRAHDGPGERRQREGHGCWVSGAGVVWKSDGSWRSRRLVLQALVNWRRPAGGRQRSRRNRVPAGILCRPAGWLRLETDSHRSRATENACEVTGAGWGSPCSSHSTMRRGRGSICRVLTICISCAHSEFMMLTPSIYQCKRGGRGWHVTQACRCTGGEATLQPWRPAAAVRSVGFAGHPVELSRTYDCCCMAEM